MKKFTSLQAAQKAVNEQESNVIAVKVIDVANDKHFWAIRHEPERAGIYL